MKNKSPWSVYGRRENREEQAQQATPHEPYRLTLMDGTYTLRALVAGSWRAMYVFDLQQVADIDYVVGNWYVCTHPDSPFLGQLIAARTGPGLRPVAGDHPSEGALAARLELLRDAVEGPRLADEVAGPGVGAPQEHAQPRHGGGEAPETAAILQGNAAQERLPESVHIHYAPHEFDVIFGEPEFDPTTSLDLTDG